MKSNPLSRLHKEIAQVAKTSELPGLWERAMAAQQLAEQQGFRWDQGRLLWRHPDADKKGWRTYGKSERRAKK